MTPEVNLTFNKRKLAVKFKLQSSENIAERGGGFWDRNRFFFAITAIQTMPPCRNM